MSWFDERVASIQESCELSDVSVESARKLVEHTESWYREPAMFVNEDGQLCIEFDNLEVQATVGVRKDGTYWFDLLGRAADPMPLAGILEDAFDIAEL